MLKRNYQLNFNTRHAIVAFALVALSVAATCFLGLADAQAVAASPSIFRIGEKLSYSISFGKITDGGYAELYVASRGKLSGRDVVEIRSKAKTQGLVNASFFMIDERRVTFAAPDTGLPVFIRRTVNDGPLPKETVNNYLKDATPNFDLITMIYKAREAGGIGTYPFLEGGQTYTATFQLAGKEHVKVDAGEFDTIVSTVQSDLFAAHGVKEIKINFTNDDERVPVLIRVKTAKGEFRASLLSVHVDEPEATPTPTPKPATTPVITVTPRPSPSASPYVENKPLLPELGFNLGETLNYTISTGGKPVATITLSAVERKLVQKRDSLLLTATITGTEPGNAVFQLGDSLKVLVDPDTLAPLSYQSKFAGGILGLNQNVIFDQRTGNISFGAKEPFDGPIGTHSLLSLVYAMRSFNLKNSKDPSNPINDTRVAVFWETRPYIFILKPANPEDLVINGIKTSVQRVVVYTGNKQLDDLKITVWLTDNSRVPVRFSFGAYQADLVSPPSNNVDNLK